ncbi:uncharacterized protein LOC111408887 [Olea europaea var. sylvestris]|uniref:FLZ-type domain-containing protein n=1 Tax=Olea europaea subsp. europaea TaxID=158383 RepID=A0A8S0SQR0_OLEEU|nr:uncharacterized protein LOC111408887 [Olea europaea var. sylvestris]CAA2994472.1 Hypothetical predicted protein [Olea europaea subsp. europaea]
MLLGKRMRPPMKRTTSMTEFTLEIDVATKSGEGTAANYQLFDPQKPVSSGGLDQRFLATATAAASPTPLRRNSADSVETAHFLRACSLCKRRLIPGRDIYMYRGDSAFCSSECRQQQMTQDERKEKSSLVTKRGAATVTTGAKASATSGETVPAV